MVRIAYILLILALSFDFAQAEVVAPPAMTFDVNTKESIIDVNGRKYRKVEYKSDVFYLRLLEPEATGADLEFKCGTEATLKMENQILISTAITRRTSLFVEGLQQTCKNMNSPGGEVTIDPNIQVGFLFNDSDSKKAIFKNKKIFMSPAKKTLGIGGEF